MQVHSYLWAGPFALDILKYSKPCGIMLPPVSGITITSGLYYANVFNYAADLTEELVNAVKVQVRHCHTLSFSTAKRSAQKAELTVKTF